MFTVLLDFTLLNISSEIEDYSNFPVCPVCMKIYVLYHIVRTKT
jgi:hypothetical protein